MKEKFVLKKIPEDLVWNHLLEVLKEFLQFKNYEKGNKCLFSVGIIK